MRWDPRAVPAVRRRARPAVRGPAGPGAGDRAGLRGRPRLRSGQPDRAPWPTGGPTPRCSGVDSSAEMIERARSASGRRQAGCRFEVGRPARLATGPSRSTSSSATPPCSGCPGTSTCCRAWSSRSGRAGGSPSRCPATSASRSHTAMAEVATSPRWADAFGGARPGPPGGREPRGPTSSGSPASAAAVDAWETTYLHVLARRRTRCVRWVSGTGLRPVPPVLDDDAEREEFLADYGAWLRAGVPGAARGARCCRSGASSSSPRRAAA